MTGWRWLAALGFLVAACGSGGSEISVDVEVTGDGVDTAIIEVGDESMTVDLPWKTTVIIEDEAGIDSFTVLATNPTEEGELTCEADWRQASSDGTWRRKASYQVSCGGRVNFQDGGTVRLDPRGRSITFEERDAAIAEEEAEAAALAAAEAERQARLGAARDGAVGVLGSVRVGDWDVIASGVLRDAEDYIEDLTSNTIRGGGVPIIVEVSATFRGDGIGDAADLLFVLYGGDSVEPFKTFDVSCGVIPEPGYETGEVAPGETVVFNVCWQVDEEEHAEALIEVDQFGVGVDAQAVRMLLPASDRLSGAAGGAAVGEVAVGDDWLVEVVDVRVNDIEKLRELKPSIDEPRDGQTFLWVETRVTNAADHADWPEDSYTDWFIVAADGVSRYEAGVRDRCSRYTSMLTDRDIGDPLVEPGDSLLVSHCWEIATEHLEGATLLISDISDDASLDLGL